MLIHVRVPWSAPHTMRQFGDRSQETYIKRVHRSTQSPVPSISRCIHIVYRHKNVWEYQWSNFIYNCMSIFLHYVHCKDALLDCSGPGGERCESLTRVDEITRVLYWSKSQCITASAGYNEYQYHIVCSEHIDWLRQHSIPATTFNPSMDKKLHALNSTGLKWLIHSQTYTVQRLKFVNG